ncbi:MAG: hypothetical protein ACRDON_07860 [Gaiellaceae bacterium]
MVLRFGFVLVLALATATAACGAEGAEEPESRPPQEGGVLMPEGDPARGIYNYEQAKAVGIPVAAVPPPDEVCPVGPPDDGFTSEELDKPEEIEALERQMATAPTCVADPRLGLFGVGYDVEAVRAAASAYEKGRIICSGFWAHPTIPADVAEPEAFARFQRERLRKAYGVEPEDELEVLVAGCRSVGGFDP